MCSSTADIETDLPMDTSASARARQFLFDEICVEHHPAVVHTSALLVSELVTNAVLYGEPPLSVKLHCDEVDGLEISVSDRSVSCPVLLGPGPEERDGWGMVLVDAMSRAWGVMPTEAGKVVWCRLRAA